VTSTGGFETTVVVTESLNHVGIELDVLAAHVPLKALATNASVPTGNPATKKTVLAPATTSKYRSTALEDPLTRT
jgi:hypothetical protein